jgi:hypothetical protein
LAHLSSQENVSLGSGQPSERMAFRGTWNGVGSRNAQAQDSDMSFPHIMRDSTRGCSAGGRAGVAVSPIKGVTGLVI